MKAADRNGRIWRYCAEFLTTAIMCVIPADTGRNDTTSGEQPQRSRDAAAVPDPPRMRSPCCVHLATVRPGRDPAYSCG